MASDLTLIYVTVSSFSYVMISWSALPIQFGQMKYVTVLVKNVVLILTVTMMRCLILKLAPVCPSNGAIMSRCAQICLNGTLMNVNVFIW